MTRYNQELLFSANDWKSTKLQEVTEEFKKYPTIKFWCPANVGVCRTGCIGLIIVSRLQLFAWSQTYLFPRRLASTLFSLWLGIWGHGKMLHWVLGSKTLLICIPCLKIILGAEVWGYACTGYGGPGIECWLTSLLRYFLEQPYWDFQHVLKKIW